MRRQVLAAAALVALAVVLAALPIGSDVYEGGEAREGLVVREMLRTGDWILPLWNGSVVPSKPPLFHWLAAGAAALSGAGVTEHTLRAPSIALAGLVVLLVFLAGRAWGGGKVAFMAALVLATTPQFLNEAGDGRVDMTLTTAITGAQLAFVHALGGGGGPTRLVLALCLALAMLAKGPVGPGLVGLTALVSALANRRLGPALRLVRPLPVLVFLAVAGGWYGLAYHHRGMDFVAKQIVSENGEALLGSSRFPYRSPFFYLAPLVLGGLPWTLVLPWALARGWRSGDLARRHAVVWAAVVLVFFSLAPLKRAAYLLPLRPALALVVGWWLAEAAEEERPAGGWGARAEVGQAVRARRPRPPRARRPAGAPRQRRGDPLHPPRGPERPRAGAGGRAPARRRAGRLLRPRPGPLARVGGAGGLGGGAREPAPLLHAPPRSGPGAAPAMTAACRASSRVPSWSWSASTAACARARSVTRDCRARERGHRLRFDSAPLDTGPGATDRAAPHRRSDGAPAPVLRRHGPRVGPRAAADRGTRLGRAASQPSRRRRLPAPPSPVTLLR